VVLDAGRAAFEAWGNETFNYGFQPETWKEGTGPVASEPQYAHEGTQMAWEGWQARAASPQATATLTVADIIAIAEDCSAKDGHLDVPAFRNELLSAGGRK
jgi:hypothetical protein